MTVFSMEAALPTHQHLRVVGNTPELGKWSPFHSHELQPTSAGDSSSKTWSTEIPFADDGKLCYRYLVCEKLKTEGSNMFTIIKCGPINECHVSAHADDGTLDTNELTWLDGWLLNETEVRLTVHNANGYPIRLFHHKNSNGYRIKVSVLNLDKNDEYMLGSVSSNIVTKVVGEYYSAICNQQDTGIHYDSSNHYSFVTQVLGIKDTIFKIEVYEYVSGKDECEVIGHGFITPGNLKGSYGILEICLCNNVAPVGILQVGYLLIKPLEEKSLHNMGSWLNRNWQNEAETLNMGHRGCGSTFSTSKEGLQENTIESFILAHEKGAHGLELDVHLTKDLQAVIYHDLHIKTSLQTKNGSKVTRTVPVHQLTYKELQEVKVDHTNSAEINSELQGYEDLFRKIFPTLEEVLTTLPIDFPIELEVKYLETEKDQEDESFLDANLYVDVILKTVLQNMGKRKIILMSFSPIIVQLISRKQKKVPVKIGGCGETDKYPVYKDIRIRTVGMIVGFAHSERILGLSCFCDHILVNPGIVDEIKKRNLVLSTWGEDNNKEDVREQQRSVGVNVLCYDRIHEVSGSA